ncbi:MAG TPA: adenosylcobinamide amidohydrolase, partial [Rhodocyclaceae bacterium]|nr:adenosylcobinamide amidohydrolase [Rhodocyclaceae bacterium]
DWHDTIPDSLFSFTNNQTDMSHHCHWIKRAVSLTFLISLFLQPLSNWAAEAIPLPSVLSATATVQRSERDGLWEKSLIVQFSTPRRAISTSDGMVEAKAAINIAAAPALWAKVGMEFQGRDGRGGKSYVDFIRSNTAAKLGVDLQHIAHMATAADLDNLAVVTREYGPLKVTVLATAGVKSNAIRTGVDEGSYIEGEEPAGTINIMVLTNIQLTDAALARALITVTEGKTAALEDLKIPSTYTPAVQATGTGTDSIIVVSGTALPKASYTGGHSRIGELIGKASYQAVVEAVGKQNGYFLSGAKRFGDAALGKPKENGALRLALLHFSPVPGEISENRKRLENQIREAVRYGADWVVTPELAETGYFFVKRIGTDWIAPFPDTWVSTLSAIARDNHIVLFVGIAEREFSSNKLYNSVVVIDREGKILGTYRKQRVLGGAEGWSSPGQEENLFQVDGLPVGVLICADTYVPTLAAHYRQKGASLLLVPSNWAPIKGMGPEGIWESRSSETGIPVVAINRTGTEPELDFSRSESVIAVAGKRVHAFHSASDHIYYLDWDRKETFKRVTYR